MEGQERLAQYLKQVECGNTARNNQRILGERKLTAKHCTAKSTSRQEANAKCEPSAMQVNTLGEKSNNQRVLGEADHAINKQKPAKRLMATSGIGRFYRAIGRFCEKAAARKVIKMKGTQRAASKSPKIRNKASCTVAKICDRLTNGFSKDVLKAECLMH